MFSEKRNDSEHAQRQLNNIKHLQTKKYGAKPFQKMVFEMVLINASFIRRRESRQAGSHKANQPAVQSTQPIQPNQ